MIFTADNQVVQAWIRQIKTGAYGRENVPSIGNLREVVFLLLDSEE